MLTGSSGSDDGAGTSTMSLKPAAFACFAVIVPFKSTKCTVPGTGCIASCGLTSVWNQPILIGVEKESGYNFAIAFNKKEKMRTARSYLKTYTSFALTEVAGNKPLRTIEPTSDRQMRNDISILSRPDEARGSTAIPNSEGMLQA